jgi:hypothetical protein
MSVNRRNASQQAADWAQKKKQQLERAQQLQEERKANKMRVAEHSIAGPSSAQSGYSAS